jgi:ArsR family transcriptional regulator, arsenate/arsenite/antimonite-responsive transcriptional repressor
MDLKQDSAVFRALGEPVRLRIVDRLAAGELCACDLLANLGISQPTLSHHMKVLTDAGLVDSRRMGVWVHYSLRAETVADLRRLLDVLGSPGADPVAGSACCAPSAVRATAKKT